MPKCRSCDASVVFARYEKSGRLGIFDVTAEKTKPGETRWRLKDRDRDGRYARRAAEGERGVFDHHATCPDAEDWRR